MTNQTGPGPGEAQTKKREMRQVRYAVLAVIVGGMIGFFVAFYDAGDGNLFGGEWRDLEMSPVAAISLSIAILFAFLGLPLYGFTQIDDYKREMSYIAFTGAFLAVLSAFPVWALLYAGGLASPPDPFGLWAIGFVAMLASYLIARWRL